MKINAAGVSTPGSVTASSYVGISPAMVTLGNVNNTSDALKPSSSATSTALNLKADGNSPKFANEIRITQIR